MSAPLLDVHAEELPRIAAEESLRRASEIALGTGSLRKEDAERLHRSLTRQAAGRVRRSASMDERLMAAAALGIEVVREPARG